MTRVSAVLTLLLLNVTSFAQNEEDAVKATINKLFEGMKKSDSSVIRSAFSPGAILQTIVKTREGKTVVRSENLDAFITGVTRPHTEIYDERISFGTIKIDADLAIAWTPYEFYLGEKFSHCGVNSFQLVRLDGAWKIQYLIDTRRKDNCK
jgi:hypothetical protein